MTNAGNVSKLPQFVLTMDGDLHGEDTPENREIVRRIHACVAACEGISTAELERGIVQDMQRVIAEVAPLLQERVHRKSAANAAAQKPLMIQEPSRARHSLQDA